MPSSRVGISSVPPQMRQHFSSVYDTDTSDERENLLGDVSPRRDRIEHETVLALVVHDSEPLRTGLRLVESPYRCTGTPRSGCARRGRACPRRRSPGRTETSPGGSRLPPRRRARWRRGTFRHGPATTCSSRPCPERRGSVLVGATHPCPTPGP